MTKRASGRRELEWHHNSRRRGRWRVPVYTCALAFTTLVAFAVFGLLQQKVCFLASAGYTTNDLVPEGLRDAPVR